MKVSDTFTEGKTVLSFEVFPPKATSPIESVYKPLEQLCALNPAYISVTYGAAGGAKSHCCEIASRIKHVHGIEPVAHLTCVGNTKQEIKAVLDDFQANGIENILALRGDIVPGQPVCHDFKYASDLTLFIKEQNPEFDELDDAFVEEEESITTAIACYVDEHLSQFVTVVSETEAQ